MFAQPEFYGSSTVGERGQIVLPIELRKKFEIEPGDKLLVLGGEGMGVWSIFLVKSDVLSMAMAKVGENIGNILAKSIEENK